MTDVQERVHQAGPEVRPVSSSSLLEQVCDGVATALAMSSRVPQRVRVQLGDATVEMEWPEARELVRTGAEAPAEVVATEVEGGQSADTRDLPAVYAPLVGTFYRAPEPGAAPFVEVGDVVEVGQQIGI